MSAAASSFRLFNIRRPYLPVELPAAPMLYHSCSTNGISTLYDLIFVLRRSGSGAFLWGRPMAHHDASAPNGVSARVLDLTRHVFAAANRLFSIIRLRDAIGVLD